MIGCGVCVHSRKIFYTLNGTFLGVAFVAKPSQLPLYPIVGLDSHASVHFNFGQRPFAFELSSLPPSLGEKAKSAEHATPSAVTALRQLALAFSRS